MARALLLCLLMCCSCSVSISGVHERSIPISSTKPETVLSSRVIATSGRTFLPLAHRHGPHAPEQSKHRPSLAETLRLDGARADHIIGKSMERIRAPSNDGVVVPAELGYSVDFAGVRRHGGLRHAGVPQTVMIDTASDLSWIQCKPCVSGECYPQKDPLFDPSSSCTYAPVPCDSGACRNISEDYGDNCTEDSRCGFRLSYADGSNTTGVYSRDKLTLAPGAVVESFRFGCGHDQQGPNDNYDGLIGLGRTPESLVSQASPVYGGAFSYCLPATRGSAGFLALGRPSDTSGFVFTPMHRSDHVSVFYRVTVTGISVAGRRLDVPPSAFPHGNYGMILDAGAIVTLLPATPYAALRAAFRRAMAAYPLAPPMGRVDTCYNLTGYSNVTVPSVSLSFLGVATVDLDVPSGFLVEGCLAFASAGPDHGNGAIGNVNQRTFEVLYDSEQGRAERCTVRDLLQNSVSCGA